VFTTMRRKRHSATMRDELGQGVEHFKRAATLAAQETSATVGPKLTAARGRVQPATTRARDAASSSWETAVATLVPLITAAGENVRLTGKKSAQVSKKEAKANKKNAKKLEKRASKALGRSRRGSGRFLGLAVAGAALGAGAAYAMRKRRAAQWEEYDGSQPLASTPPVSSAGDGAFEPTGSATTSTSSESSTPEGMTASTTTGTSTAGTSAAPSDTTGSTTTGTSTAGTSAAPSDTTGSDSPLVATDTTDQTASAQHSPTVARMASGQNTKD
jgi:hypothetical protein